MANGLGSRAGSRADDEKESREDIPILWSKKRTAENRRPCRLSFDLS